MNHEVIHRIKWAQMMWPVLLRSFIRLYIICDLSGYISCDLEWVWRWWLICPCLLCFYITKDNCISWLFIDHIWSNRWTEIPKLAIWPEIHIIILIYYWTILSFASIVITQLNVVLIKRHEEYQWWSGNIIWLLCKIGISISLHICWSLKDAKSSKRSAMLCSYVVW